MHLDFAEITFEYGREGIFVFLKSYGDHRTHSGAEIQRASEASQFIAALLTTDLSDTAPFGFRLLFDELGTPKHGVLQARAASSV